MELILFSCQGGESKRGCWESDPCGRPKLSRIPVPPHCGRLVRVWLTKALVGDTVGPWGRRAPSRPQARPEARWHPDISPALPFRGFGLRHGLGGTGLAHMDVHLALGLVPCLPQGPLAAFVPVPHHKPLISQSLCSPLQIPSFLQL